MYVGAIWLDLHFKKSFASCITFKETEECFLPSFSLMYYNQIMLMGDANWPATGGSLEIQQQPLVQEKSRKIQTSLKARKFLLEKKRKKSII